MRTKKLLTLIFLLLTFATSIYGAHYQNVPLKKIAADNKLHIINGTSFGANGAIFTFKENSRTFTFNKILMPLGFPTIRSSGSIAINSFDVQKCVSPLIPTKRPQYKKLNIIVLDAGHGGSDNGTVSKINGINEKTLTLDICNRVAALLKQDGYKVILTRATDKKVALFERTNIANRHNADLFLSIHFNSAPSQSANGIETFILTPSMMPSTYNTNAAKTNLSGNKFDITNTILGYSIQESFIQTTKSIDRGVKYSRFNVLRNLKCPGALVECGFLSNRTEATKIASAAHREKIAQSIFLGIKKFESSVAE